MAKRYGLTYRYLPAAEMMPVYDTYSWHPVAFSAVKKFVRASMVGYYLSRLTIPAVVALVVFLLWLVF